MHGKQWGFISLMCYDTTVHGLRYLDTTTTAITTITITITITIIIPNLFIWRRRVILHCDVSLCM